nr:class I SAM-dependent methyltransferase [Bdellovibrio sp. HM001]
MTVNKSKIDTFWKSREKIDDARIATNYRDDGRLEFDVALVRKYHREGGSLLDLGCGTGTLARELLQSSSYIKGVDKYPGFLEKCPREDKFEVVESDILHFVDKNKTYDTIIIFGVVNFISDLEEVDLYRKCLALLKDDGVLIVKNQCGVKSEVIVDSYSQELGTDYYARYPWFERQLGHLSEHFNTELVDIYPPAMNRWDNTHFYAFVARPK